MKLQPGIMRTALARRCGRVGLRRQWQGAHHAGRSGWAFRDSGLRPLAMCGYFPGGHGHQLEALGNEPRHFILIFDNGYPVSSALQHH